MTLECPTCHATVRIPTLPKGRIRCGKCQHIFTPQELMRAKPEAPPRRVLQPDPDDFIEDAFDLEIEDDD